MLFKRDTLAGIARGDVTMAFRRWKRPTVRAGGSLVTPIGRLAIDAVMQVRLTDITDRQARQAGMDSANDVRRALRQRPDGSFYRVDFHRAGDDPRLALRERGTMDPAELQSLLDRLDRLDRTSARGPWTKARLGLLGRRSGVRAGDLAEELGQDLQTFKRDVRKLKNLGLTISLRVGYRLSPRGAAALAALDS